MTREFGSSASRSMFACSEETNFLGSSGRVTVSSPSMRSFFSSSSGRSTFSKSRASLEFKGEDEALLVLAANARAKVEHARQVFATAGWKERKDGQGVRMFERKATGVFDIAASTTLPCSASEILEVLSSHNSDDFNATMVALAGDAFSYAVTLREVPTASLNTHLTTKRMQFSGSIPLVSSTKTIEFLDYVEFDYKTRTAVRTFQTLTRDRAGRLIVAGDVLAGYILAEQVQSHQTSVFYFGTSAFDETACKGNVKAKLKAAAVRETSSHALVKLAKLIPKVGDIALRRRLGAEDTVDPSDNTGDGSCSGCGKLVKESLLRKKHVCYICGHHTCGSCSKSQDVEGLIGVIERLRICCMCISSARHRAFDTVDEIEDGPVYLLRPSIISGLSTTSTSRTASTTPSSVRTRMLPATA
ncbi:hypothetical protein DVH05_022668 [Phytophthora capsici]|nr:hypothetical protein DVH05_022668 [Phytophthora capsici]